MSLAPGERHGAYEIVALLGAGGMGEVYKARDTRLDRMVAIKFCDARFGERFEREARAIAGLNHPNICQLHDVGPDYLVMELGRGGPGASCSGGRGERRRPKHQGDAGDRRARRCGGGCRALADARKSHLPVFGLGRSNRSRTLHVHADCDRCVDRDRSRLEPRW